MVIRLPVPELSGCSSVGVDNTLDRSAPIARRPLSGIEPRPMLLGVNRSKGMLLLGLWVTLSNLLPLLSFRASSFTDEADYIDKGAGAVLSGLE